MLIRFPGKNRAQVQRVSGLRDLVGAIHELDISSPSPVLVLVGGAAGIQQKHLPTIRQAIQEISDVVELVGAIIVDGGTESGIMAEIGQARSRRGHTYPLVGVAVESLVTWPNRSDAVNASSAAPLDANHTFFVLVPGTDWGDEVRFLARTGTVLSGNLPSVTVLINGGLIAANDLKSSIDEGREVIVLAGTGRYADELASNPPDSADYNIVQGDDRENIRKELLRRLQ